ncbi:hypothetical protein OCUBac02_26000 [Bosea sp. ANAM02]|nr:hypothetical protein OCUBac02_26000 [Bosea sp. ANAM02]
MGIIGTSASRTNLPNWRRRTAKVLFITGPMRNWPGAAENPPVDVLLMRNPAANEAELWHARRRGTIDGNEGCGLFACDPPA